MEYKLSNEATINLSNIWDYTCSQWSIRQAELYVELLIDSCNTIRKHPHIGKKLRYKKRNLYILEVSEHCILYSVEKEFIIIAGFIHKKQNLKSFIDNIKTELGGS